MPRNKTEKTTISFERSELLKGIIGDYAIKENRSFSAIIEGIVLDCILPNNHDARMLIEEHLYSENGSVGRILATLFDLNSHGVNWEARHDNLLPIVRFAMSQVCICSIPISGDEKELYHTCSQIESVLEHLTMLTATETDDSKKKYFEREAEWGHNLLTELRENPQNSHLFNFYRILVDNWESLKKLSVTYRLLYDLTTLEQGWRNDSASRIKLLELIREISAEWDLR